LKVLGFSDHSPQIFPGGYYSTFRMYPEQLNDYVQTVLALRKEYEGRIEIPLGLELEYYPTLLPELLPILRDQPMDYLLLGQHFVGNEFDDHYTGYPTEEKRLLEKYCDQTIEAMQTGLFACFAHPDLVNFRGDTATYVRQVRRICREAKSCGIPLEYNLLGLSEGKHYPNIRFWEVAAEEGCQVILGRDAHRPDALLDEKYPKMAMETLRKLGLTPLERLDLEK
jgi:histidinol-phosphatase (PHP family)